MLLSIHEDPSAAVDFALCDIAEELELLEAQPAEAMSPYRHRAADLADRLSHLARNAPRKGE